MTEAKFSSKPNISTYHNGNVATYREPTQKKRNQGKPKVKKKGVKITTQKNNTKQQTYKKDTCILSQKNQSKSTTTILDIKPRNKFRLPLGKIKRVRLVSAKQEINQTNDKGRERKINHK